MRWLRGIFAIGGFGGWIGSTETCDDVGGVSGRRGGFSCSDHVEFVPACCPMRSCVPIFGVSVLDFPESDAGL